MKVVKSSCGGKKRVRTCTFSPQVNIKNKREPIQTQEDVNAAHSEAKIQDLIEDLKNVIWTKVSHVATSDSFGFDEDEVNDYFFVDVTPTEIGEDHHEAVRVEVRAEVSYEGLEELMDALNPIIESYDSYAYFEPVEPGIIEAYVSVDQVDMSVYGGSEYADSSQSEYTNRVVLRYKNKSFTIYDNSDSINLPADADLEALRKWKAQITQQAGAYNDADEDYEWASLSNGVVSYYRRGKLVDKSYYMSPSDWDVETLGEWSESVINDVIENLYEANKDVPDRMVHNSTNVLAASLQDPIDLDNLPDDFVQAYLAAKEDFESAYENAFAELSLVNDSGSNDDEVCAVIEGTDVKGKPVSGKVYLYIYTDNYDAIYQAFEETAEAIGLLEDNTVYSSVESSDSTDSELIRKAVSADPKAIKTLENKGYSIRPIVNPLSYNEVGTYKVIDPNGNSYTYDNTLSYYAKSKRSINSTDDKVFVEDIIDELEDNGYDLSRIRSIRQGLLELFGYKGKDADIIIHDMVAGRFIDPNDWVDKDYIPGVYSATKKEYKTSENYKGRRIRLLHDGTGYAIFEKGEMIDYGFKSLEDAEAAIDEYDDIYQDDVQVYSATVVDADKNILEWSKLDYKYIPNYDETHSFTTYTLYSITLEDGSVEYECYSGDPDVNGPWNGQGLEFEAKSEKEAIKKFHALRPGKHWNPDIEGYVICMLPVSGRDAGSAFYYDRKSGNFGTDPIIDSVYDTYEEASEDIKRLKIRYQKEYDEAPKSAKSKEYLRAKYTVEEISDGLVYDQTKRFHREVIDWNLG